MGRFQTRVKHTPSSRESNTREMAEVWFGKGHGREQEVPGGKQGGPSDPAEQAQAQHALRSPARGLFRGALWPR